MNVEFKSIQLNVIKPDPNQPRKFYDQTAMQELTDSVREKGILQPILIRKKDGVNGYLIVCGERRYKAALAVQALHKDRDSIPAVIRQLTDEEALELQIIENLQRKDVHPMEEAVAFKSLIDKGKDISEIAARVGKSVFYARQRLKLNDLSKDWQKIFYAGRLNNGEALKIAVFDSKIQNAIYKEEAEGKSGPVELSNWSLRSYRGDLNNASFSLEDPSLDKKMGSCNSCSLNSANSLLFPDSVQSAKCGNISCFKGKSDNHFILELEAALLEPDMVFVHDNYGHYNDKFTAKVEKNGQKVLPAGNYTTISKPELEEYEDWFENFKDDYDMSENEFKNKYEKEVVKSYKKELLEYNEKVAGGKYKKAFVINGEDRGKYIYVTNLRGAAINTGRGTSRATAEKELEGKLTVADIDNEIKRINEREKRSKELDLNKIHQETLVQLAKKKTSVLSMKHQGSVDRGILMYILLHETNGVYNLKQKSGIKGLPPEPGYKSAYTPDYFKALSKITDDQLAQILRTIALDKWGGSMTGDVRPEDTALRMISEYSGIDLKAIERAQAEVSDKRQERIKDRISGLKEQKSLLIAKQPLKKK